MLRIFIAVAGLSTCLVFADELGFPEFKAQPHKYLNKHENCVLSGSNEPGKEWTCGLTADELVVGDVSKRELTYWLWVIGTNGHQCNMTGQAQLVSAGKYEYREDDCRLSLRVSDSHITVHDIGSACTIKHCASRASIGEIEFRIER